jgi:hypothetical protein
MEVRLGRVTWQLRARGDQGHSGMPVELAMLFVGSLAFATLGGPAGTRDAPTPRASSEAASTLCQSVPHLDRLVIQRSDAFPQNHMRFSFADVVTVTDGARVQDAARSLCASPTVPRGTFHCPADFGIAYQLAFTGENRTTLTVSVDATGCQGVRGLSPARWVPTSPRFWHNLGLAMGLAMPDYGTFRGDGSDG